MQRCWHKVLNCCWVVVVFFFLSYQHNSSESDSWMAALMCREMDHLYVCLVLCSYFSAALFPYRCHLSPMICCHNSCARLQNASKQRQNTTATTTGTNNNNNDNSNNNNEKQFNTMAHLFCNYCTPLCGNELAFLCCFQSDELSSSQRCAFGPQIRALMY